MQALKENDVKQRLTDLGEQAKSIKLYRIKKQQFGAKRPKIILRVEIDPEQTNFSRSYPRKKAFLERLGENLQKAILGVSLEKGTEGVEAETVEIIPGDNYLEIEFNWSYWELFQDTWKDLKEILGEEKDKTSTKAKKERTPREDTRRKLLVGNPIENFFLGKMAGRPDAATLIIKLDTRKIAMDSSMKISDDRYIARITPLLERMGCKPSSARSASSDTTRCLEFNFAAEAWSPRKKAAIEFLLIGKPRMETIEEINLPSAPTFTSLATKKGVISSRRLP